MDKTKKQRKFFDDYSVAQPILEKGFYYGSYSEQDFAEAGICKKSKYFDRQKTLRYVFGDLIEETRNAKGQKALNLRIDHLYDPHRAFLRFFALKSFTSVGRLLRICYIIQKINASGSCTVRELSEELDIILGGAESHSTVVRILNNMYSKGFIIMQVLLQTKPIDNPVYDFLIKKQSEGKHYYSYMNAAANKFLRIYYAKVKEVLTAADTPT